jgi:RsiW-degrading membrane proteinase PrsW (M82 family)
MKIKRIIGYVIISVFVLITIFLTLWGIYNHGWRYVLALLLLGCALSLFFVGVFLIKNNR